MSHVTLRASRHVRLGRLFRPALFSTAFLDELTVGFLVVAMPLIRDDLRLTYEQAGFLFTLGALSGMVLDPAINLLSDRRSKRMPIVAGMAIMLVSFALAATAHAYLVLVVAIVLMFPANGAAVGLSQATLIELDPASGERTMTRWTTMSAIGDVLAPVLVTLLIGAGLRWNALFVLAALVWLGALAVMWPQRFPRPGAATPVDAAAEAAPHASLLVSLRAALGDRVLLRWVGIVTLAAMLDEVFLAFTALYLHDRLHADSVAVGVAITIFTAGCLFGLPVLERLLARVPGTQLLPWLALLTLGGVMIFLVATSVWLAAAALFVIGLCSTGWYPIAQAGAYAARPQQAGIVLTVLACAAPFEVALPGVIGLVAGHFGITAGIALLGLAPLGVLFLAPRRQ